MWGPSLALMTRSLRVDARLLRTHLLRAAFVSIIFISMMFWHLMSLLTGAPGLEFFSTITWLNFVFITVAGLSYFATAITEEKDESMLGLLQMAGIGPLALLLGKSTTRLVTSLLILAVQFPFTLLAITLGGVTLVQVVAVYLALASYMILLANLGLLCSVYARGSARAAGLMTVLVVLMLGVVPFAAQALNKLVSDGSLPDDRVTSGISTVLTWFEDASILGRLTTILQSGFDEAVFSTQVAASLIGAVGLFAISWITFERWTDEQAAAVASWRDLLSPSSSKAGQRKPYRVWRHPLWWKDFYFALGGRRVMFAKLVLYGAVTAIIAVISFDKGGLNDANRKDFSEAVLAAVVIIAAIELSIYASTLFREEVRLQTLPMLMLLPISTAKIAYSKVLAVLPALFPAALFALVACASHVSSTLPLLLDVVSTIQAWVGLAVFVLFLHVTAYMSLLVKWGALPLSLFIMYFTQSCMVAPLLSIFMILGMLTHSEGMIFIPYIATCVIACYVLQIFIVRRLEAVASQ